MTQEDKELLLRDLSARLSYGVIVRVYSNDGDYDYSLTGIINSQHEYPEIEIDGRLEDEFCIQSCKPYLRPLSSMTEEERKYIEDKCAFTPMGPIGGNFCLVMPVIAAEWLIDFYNSHHLDWRGLIEKGLALEAPKGIY